MSAARRSMRRFVVPVAALVVAAVAFAAQAARAASPTPPIALAYVEGDVAGSTPIWSPDGKRLIGIIDYRQRRERDRLVITRAARFKDGSSDEDEAEALVGEHLESLRGRMVIRDTRGKPTVDVAIDVGKRRLTGFYVDGGKRVDVDQEADIGSGTYWGALFNLVLKNFEKNANGDAVTFQTVALTPKPRVLDMVFTRAEATSIRRTGGAVKTTRFTLFPTVNFLVDPILRRFVPKTEFFMDGGKPPMMIRFDGPRNYSGVMMRLQ